MCTCQGGEREVVIGVDDELMKGTSRRIPRADVAELCIQSLTLPEASNRHASACAYPESALLLLLLEESRPCTMHCICKRAILAAVNVALYVALFCSHLEFPPFQLCHCQWHSAQDCTLYLSPSFPWCTACMAIASTRHCIQQAGHYCVRYCKNHEMEIFVWLATLHELRAAGAHCCAFLLQVH